MCLILNNLNISFVGKYVVRDMSLTLSQGEILGIIGESGSGKTMLAKALIGLVPQPGIVSVGQLQMFERRFYEDPVNSFESIRGKDIAMITQDPIPALNPIMQVGKQIAEAAIVHHKVPPKLALEQALSILTDVKIRDPKHVMHCYPHQLSGGMAQRVVIAMMLMCAPQILIADEITSALDTNTRQEIVGIIKDFVERNNMSVIMISHDINQVLNLCNKILVMYNGQAVEYDRTSAIINSCHPYTKALLDCMPNKEKRGSPLYEISASSLASI